MGEFEVSSEHVRQVIDNYPKDQHFLCSSFLEGMFKPRFKQ